MKMARTLSFCVLWICLALPIPALARNLTALQALALASKEVHTDAKDHVIEIYGRRNSKETLPTKWDILFYDPHAQQEGRLVQISEDRIIGIKEGFVQMFRLAAYKKDEAMNLEDATIDSPDVLRILQTTKALSGIKIRSLEMKLIKKSRGTIPAEWNVWLYGAGKTSNQLKKFGKARISAEDGRILELQFDPEKLR